MNKWTDDRDLGEVKAMLEDLIRRHGPRLAGTRACLDAAKDLHDAFARVCDRAWKQPFTLHPASFWVIPSLVAAAFTLAGLLYLFRLSALGAGAAMLGGLVFGLVQFIFLGRFFDPLFPKRFGMNVAGVTEPSNEAQRQILICAHHDSALRCRFMERFQVLYPLRMIPAMLLYLLTTAAFLLLLIPPLQPLLNRLIPFLLLIGSLFILPFFFFYRRRGTPGAGDNLLASVLLVKTAGMLRERVGRLNNTRLIWVSHDGEEVGMRGAHAFLSEHRDLLSALPTRVINLDSLHRLEDLTLLASDRNGTVELSAEWNRELAHLWGKIGYRPAERPLPPGGGGTDAAVYAAWGLPTASLIGLSTSFIRSGMVYHTADDDLAHLDDRIIPAVLNMLQAVIQREN